jgi:hypothetical protein
VRVIAGNADLCRTSRGKAALSAITISFAGALSTESLALVSGPEPSMPCFCSAQLSSLLGSLSGIPSVAGLVPPISMSLIAAVSAAPPGGSMSARASATASGSLTANLALMANLAASLRATTGMNLLASLGGTAQASLQASLSATINSLNANAGALNLHQGLLDRLLRELAALSNLAGIVGAVRASCGIDLRAAGAIGALQARLAAMAQLNASVRPAMAAQAVAQVSAAESLMATLGFPISVQGAAALGASMQALAQLTLALPPITVNLGLLSLLSALMAILAAIRNALGVNLLTANALASLRLALAALPLAALASLQVQSNASAALDATAAASASALAGLDLSAAATANLSAAASLALVLGLTAQHTALLMPAGTCGSPCPVALLKAV